MFVNQLKKILQSKQSYLRIRNLASSSSKMGKLDGKVAIVTASTEGIGFSIAKKLAEDGAKVVISSRKQANVDKAVSSLQKNGLDVSGIVCHVAKANDRKSLVKHTLDKYKGIDILVSNAAVNPHFGNILEISEEQWDKIFEINVKAAFLLSKEIVPHMEKKGSGSIVFVSSVGGFVPFPGIGAYSLSKTALFGLTKVMGTELGSRNIRVNCLAPGVIKTNFSSAMWQNDAIKDEVVLRTPLGRLGNPDDCGGIVSFLSSDDASFITGEIFVVGGGITSHL